MHLHACAIDVHAVFRTFGRLCRPATQEELARTSEPDSPCNVILSSTDTGSGQLRNKSSNCGSLPPLDQTAKLSVLQFNPFATPLKFKTYLPAAKAGRPRTKKSRAVYTFFGMTLRRCCCRIRPSLGHSAFCHTVSPSSGPYPTSHLLRPPHPPEYTIQEYKNLQVASLPRRAVLQRF